MSRRPRALLGVSLGVTLCWLGLGCTKPPSTVPPSRVATPEEKQGMSTEDVNKYKQQHMEMKKNKAKEAAGKEADKDKGAKPEKLENKPQEDKGKKDGQ